MNFYPRNTTASCSSVSVPSRASLDLLDWESNRARFKLLSILGRGQFSVVHKGYDELEQRVVAIKSVWLHTIHEEKIRRDCIKEIALLKSLQHPNIVRLFSAYSSQCGNELTLVLDLADQGDLAGVITTCRQRRILLSPVKVLNYLSQILAAVQHLHAKRILHRDIKPANIFLSTQSLKLGDLGFSRFLSNKTNSVESFLGTPYYMAPERLNEHRYSFPSDIWSVGCVLYEMVALHSPFFSKHNSLLILCKRIEAGLYPPLPNRHMYPYLIDKIINSCLIPNPDQRVKVSTIIHWMEKDQKKSSIQTNPFKSMLSKSEFK